MKRQIKNGKLIKRLEKTIKLATKESKKVNSEFQKFSLIKKKKLTFLPNLKSFRDEIKVKNLTLSKTVISMRGQERY